MRCLSSIFSTSIESGIKGFAGLMSQDFFAAGMRKILVENASFDVQEQVCVILA
jgi:hypothetical protein